VGLVPSPVDLEMPGARKYTSTMLQMEIEACRQSDKRVEDLTNHLDIIQETLDRLLQQQNANSTPHGSNNAPHVVTVNFYLLHFFFVCAIIAYNGFYFDLELEGCTNLS